MSFGERLQEVRRSSGMTQEQFAEELNVSRQAVSKWESGKGYPEIEKILYICNRYRVPLGRLFSEEVPPLEAEASPSEAPAQSELPRGNLNSAVSGFLSNLSPKNKWLGIGVLAGVVFLAALLAVFLKGGATNMETTIWIAAIVIFGVVEAMTAGLVSIWFVIGSVAGLVTAVCGGKIWLQAVVFFVVSIAALIATRPLVARMSKKDNVATNADRVLGGLGRVTETIDNTIPTGAVYIDGKTWSARSEDGSVIKTGQMVRVSRMEGVRLFVESTETK